MWLQCLSPHSSQTVLNFKGHHTSKLPLSPSPPNLNTKMWLPCSLREFRWLTPSAVKWRWHISNRVDLKMKWNDICNISNTADTPQVFCFCFLFVCFSLFLFLGLHPRHMEVPRLGVQPELKPLAYATSHSNARSERCLQSTPQLMAMPDP